MVVCAVREALAPTPANWLGLLTVWVSVAARLPLESVHPPLQQRAALPSSERRRTSESVLSDSSVLGGDGVPAELRRLDVRCRPLRLPAVKSVQKHFQGTFAFLRWQASLSLVYFIKKELSVLGLGTERKQYRKPTAVAIFEGVSE